MKTLVEQLVEGLVQECGLDDEGEMAKYIIQKAKATEAEQKYSIEFIKWYSGMDKEKIENAHKRWINETLKSE